MNQQSDILSTLRRRVAKASESPGIYRWKNAEGDVLYIGKAKNLRNRLKSYVNAQAAKGLGPWKLSLLNQIADFDLTVTNSELEALVLETNLIKELRPKYNVLMKDDKNYVYVHITMKDPYPKVDIVRRIEDDGAKYFGPFISAFDTKRSLDMLNELFCYRACNQSVDALNKAKGDQEAVYGTGKLRPCLDYQIGQCSGTCAGAISGEEYRSRIDRVIDFFKGNYKPVIDAAREEMMKAATEKKFERAGKLRDLLKVVENMQEKQIVSDTSGEDSDVLGLALLSGKVQVVIMQKRSGKLVGEQQFSLVGSAESIAEVLEQFLPQYYESVVDIPEAVIVGEDFPSREAFEEYLSSRRGKKTRVIVPERGNKSRLLELAEENAQEKAKQAEASWEADKRNTERALEELVALLDLPAVPARIEGYDISHTGGTETVGSMVVFTDGKPRNDHYRSFTIHSMQRGAVDDYRALKEVLTRRLRHLKPQAEAEEWEKSGIEIRSARVADEAAIESVMKENPEDLAHDPVATKEFMIATHESEIVGMARLYHHDGGQLEIRSVWIHPSYRGGRLGQFLVRSLLKKVKKGKVYATIDPALEQYYATVGFRHVLKHPSFIESSFPYLHKKGISTPLVMAYEAISNKPDVSFSTVPDLIVIDGGKGQLGVGVEVLSQFGLTIPVIGLAKREEEVFVPGKPVSLLIQKDSPAKFLLMRLRDEAHRFANRHRSKRARKTALTSQLDSVAGIGPETKQILLATFGSVDAIKRMGDEELGEVLSTEQIARLREVL